MRWCCRPTLISVDTITSTGIQGMGQILRDELGTFNGRTYLLIGEADPDFNTPDWFSVSIIYRDTTTLENVEIARIDNKSHGHTHFDRLFEDDNPKEPFNGNFWAACKYLSNNWENYARRYERNNG